MHDDNREVPEDGHLETIIAGLKARHGRPVTQWKSACMLERHTLMFDRGQVVVSRELPGGSWSVDDQVRTDGPGPKRPDHISAAVLPNMEG